MSQLAELAVVALRAALAPVVDELRGAREELAGARGELSKIHSEVSSLEHFVRLGVVEWANR